MPILFQENTFELDTGELLLLVTRVLLALDKHGESGDTETRGVEEGVLVTVTVTGGGVDAVTVWTVVWTSAEELLVLLFLLWSLSPSTLTTLYGVPRCIRLALACMKGNTTEEAPRDESARIVAAEGRCIVVLRRWIWSRYRYRIISGVVGSQGSVVID